MLEKLQKLFNNPKPVIILILAFILLFLAYEANASEVEVGPTFTSQFNGGVALAFSERLGGKYDIGVTLVSAQSWEAVSVKNNGNVFGQYVAKRPANWTPFLPNEISLGAAYWITTNRLIGCHLGYYLGLKWRPTQNFSIGWRHGSNAGTCQNRGQDILMFGWRF